MWSESPESGQDTRPALPASRRSASLSLAEARRIALAAQGFATAAPAGRVDLRHLRRMFRHIGLLQMDAVNVLVRAHYLPLFSRLGPYPVTQLDRFAYHPADRGAFEYWGHEASLLPLASHPLLRWRMARAERGQGIYRSLAEFGRERRSFIDAVLEEVRERGPLAASDLSAGGRRNGGWWGWSDGKRALEWLFWAGQVTTQSRGSGFERRYDLPERVLPPAVLAAATPAEDEAQRQLLRLAARALGIATERDLRDYFRLDAAATRSRLAELVEAGDLVPVAVEGWGQPAFLDPQARRPRRVETQALLSPFDSLIWERPRVERLFNLRYRLEIYTPAHKRTHGYYVLPLLQDERLVARLDLKADRAAGRLRVAAAHAEPGEHPGSIAERLSGELRRMADWLGLADVEVGEAGSLARALGQACRSVKTRRR